MSQKKIPFTKEKIKSVKTGPAILSIGKNGINEGLIKEIKIQLKKNKLIKIKIHKSILENPESDRVALAEKITSKTNSTLYETRGNTFIIYKK
ncbi:MAG: YhbY family RNA-binding protein [Candidatus Helarchaeota archaeon]